MKVYFCLICAVLTTACSPTIEYGRRSSNEPRISTPYKPPVVHVSSTAQASKTGDAALTQFSPLTQAELHLELQNPSEGAIKALKMALDAGPDKTQFVSDRTVAKRTIVVTVTRGEYRPADRFVNFRLRIRPVNFEFSGYTGTQTEYSQVDIESFSLTKKNSFGLEINGGGSGSTTGKASGGHEATLLETGGVNTRIENTTTNLEDGVLDIYREAERGIDLSGNTLVAIGVTAPIKKASTDLDWDVVATDLDLSKDGKSLSPDAASIKIANLSYLKPNDLQADLEFDYVMRRVLTKSNEYAEHNQTVEYEVGTCRKENAVLVAGRDLAIPRWSITLAKSQAPGSAVSLETEFGIRALAFVDYGEAIRFSIWMMNQKATQIGPSRLSLPDESGNVLDRSAYPELTVQSYGERLELSGQKPSAGNGWKCSPEDVHFIRSSDQPGPAQPVG